MISKADKTPKFMRKMFPEFEAGGFFRSDQKLIFYSRVNALLDPSMTVLNFGAGRGKWNELLDGYMQRLVRLKGKCERVVGADVDPVVFENPMLDEAHVFTPGEKLPFADEQFDMIVSFAVFEHVADAELYAAELSRILKPGGWICAWTPNKWGYAGIGARLVPESMQVKLLKFFTPSKKEEDSFPTVHRMNTLGAIKRLFPEKRFRHCSYVFTGPPTYHANRWWLARIWMLYTKIVPGFLGLSLHIFVQKRRSSD